METTDVAALEEKLKEAEAAIQDIFKTGRIPTADDYFKVDQIKAKLKTARRVKSMDAKRVDPKLTRKFTIMLSEDEYQALVKKANNVGVDLSKHIRNLLKSNP